MSEQTPGGIVLPTPQQVAEITPKDTQDAIQQIALGRNDRAAISLKELALAVINAVNDVDKRYSVHDFLVKLEIRCTGPGQFYLDITDKNSDVDPQAVVDEVAEVLDREKGDYFKPNRSIQMEFTNERAAAEGPDGVPSGEVPGTQEGE
jgi:hypothetical protein